MTKLTPAQELVRASLMSRRRLMKSAVAFGAVGFAAPLMVENAFSSSGELNFEGWAGYGDLKKVVMPAFEKATGIKTNFKEVDDQDVMLADAKTLNGSGAVDVMEPTVNVLNAWAQNGVVQGWDLKKIAMDNYVPGLPGSTAGDVGEVKGERLFVPSVWGTEALTFDPKAYANGKYGQASLADLFADGMDGKVAMRAHSSLAAMGRVLESQDKLGGMKFSDGYKDEATMKKIWDMCLAEALKHKKNVAQFWSSEDQAQAAFRQNGAVLGLTWDSTGYNMGKDGYGFIAPKEGAFAWSQGFVLMKGAKNVDQAHAFAKWISTPEGSGMWASAFSANPVGKDGTAHMAPDVPKFYAGAYPGDAIGKLWWWPSADAWYLKLRGEYAEKWKSAKA